VNDPAILISESWAPGLFAVTIILAVKTLVDNGEFNCPSCIVVIAER